MSLLHLFPFYCYLLHLSFSFYLNSLISSCNLLLHLSILTFSRTTTQDTLSLKCSYMPLHTQLRFTTNKMHSLHSHLCIVSPLLPCLSTAAQQWLWPWQGPAGTGEVSSAWRHWEEVVWGRKGEFALVVCVCSFFVCVYAENIRQPLVFTELNICVYVHWVSNIHLCIYRSGSWRDWGNMAKTSFGYARIFCHTRKRYVSDITMYILPTFLVPGKEKSIMSTTSSGGPTRFLGRINKPCLFYFLCAKAHS